MKMFLLAAALLATPAFAQTAPAPTPAPADVTGTWNISGDVAGVAVVEACTFAVTGDGTLTGSCDVQGAKWPTTGSVKATGVTFSHAGKYNGDDYTIVYHGKLDKGALSGTMDVDPFGVTGSFTATKGAATTAAK